MPDKHNKSTLKRITLEFSNAFARSRLRATVIEPKTLLLPLLCKPSSGPRHRRDTPERDIGICRAWYISSLSIPSRETKFSGTHGDRGMFIFPFQLTTSRIGNLTRLIHTLLYVMTIHTYIHLFSLSLSLSLLRLLTWLKRDHSRRRR